MARLTINSPLTIIIGFLVVFLLVNLSLIYVAQTSFQVDINHELSRILKRSVMKDFGPYKDIGADQSKPTQGLESGVEQGWKIAYTNKIDGFSSKMPEFQYLEEMYEDYYEDEEQLQTEYYNREDVADGDEVLDENVDNDETGSEVENVEDELEENEEEINEMTGYSKTPEFQYLEEMYGDYYENDGGETEGGDTGEVEDDEQWDQNFDSSETGYWGYVKDGDNGEYDNYEHGVGSSKYNEAFLVTGYYVNENEEFSDGNIQFMGENGEFVDDKEEILDENIEKLVQNKQLIDNEEELDVIYTSEKNGKWISNNNGGGKNRNSGKFISFVVSKNNNVLDKRDLTYTARHVNGLQVSLEEYRSGRLTGNDLIDLYGKNDLMGRGEMGKPVVLTPEEKAEAELAMSEFNVNTVASGVVPLNRLVPDSRIKHCDKLKYNIESLPSVSIIVPFYNEDPSFLIRTVYSVINRSPRHLVEEIILVDDGSTLDWLHDPLDVYIAANFPQGLVRVLRNSERQGLIKARMRGCNEAKGEVLIFFDSHMEVNIDWLPPLLSEIAQDRTVVAMSTLDYIQPDTLEYKFYRDYLIRYGWNWRLGFYELYFRDDQIGPDPRKPRPGPTMVGAAFAIDKEYFLHLGGYDQAMSIWGGENLEMGWRVWLCGGQLLHVPCSRVGHVERKQPYSFPGGREQIEHFNYKRAISVWMGNYTKYVYSIYPDMKTLNVGDISQRLELKAKLKCKDFGWYLKNIWPELAVFDENILHWGQIKNKGNGQCLDNDNNLYQDEMPLYLNPCNMSLDYQAFALTREQLLKTSLSCVVAHKVSQGSRVKMEDCIIGSRDKWTYTRDQRLVHKSSQMCLDVISGHPVVNICKEGNYAQQWTFHPYKF